MKFSFSQLIDQWFKNKSNDQPHPTKEDNHTTTQDKTTIPENSTPWVDWFVSRLGWTEFDHNKELSQYWHLSGHPEFHSVIGKDRAWCAMSMNAALDSAGMKGTGKANALSFATYGEPCEDKEGAILVIEHPDGNHHVTLRHNGKCLGGNQSNKISITTFPLPDKVIAVRWPVKK